MNWAAARGAGITPTSPTVHSGVSYRSDAAAGLRPYLSGVYVEGVSLRVAGQLLSPVRILISGGLTDSDEPWINLGLDAFRDRVLFISNSTGVVCVSPPERL